MYLKKIFYSYNDWREVHLVLTNVREFNKDMAYIIMLHSIEGRVNERKVISEYDVYYLVKYLTESYTL